MVTHVQGTPDRLDYIGRYVFDHRFARHTLGRIDSVFRTVVGAWATVLMAAKVAIKFTVCLISFGILDRLIKSWGYEGLMRDGAMMLAMGYKTAMAARDVVVAPRDGYRTSVLSAINSLEYVFGGSYHEDEASKNPMDILKGAYRSDPIAAITDEGYLAARRSVKTRYMTRDEQLAIWEIEKVKFS
jgi:hypothetical protein